MHISEGDTVVLDRNRGLAKVIKIHKEIPNEAYYTVHLLESDVPVKELQTTPSHIIARADVLLDLHKE